MAVPNSLLSAFPSTRTKPEAWVSVSVPAVCFGARQPKNALTHLQLGAAELTVALTHSAAEMQLVLLGDDSAFALVLRRHSAASRGAKPAPAGMLRAANPISGSSYR